MRRSEKILIAVLLLLSLLFLATCVFGQTPQPAFDVNTVDVSKISAAEIEATARHKERLFDELIGILKDKNPAVINQLRASLKSANETAITAAKHAEELQQERDEAVAARDHLASKLHLAKWILCGVWLAACALVALRMAAIGMYVAGGLAIAGVSFIWMWI